MDDAGGQIVTTGKRHFLKDGKPQETLLHSEQKSIPARRGGGTLKFAWYGFVDKTGRQVITRYSLAWINPILFVGDNGRVLGFDNAHGFHHRHFMGVVEAVEYSNFEATFDRFVSEWQTLVQKRMAQTRHNRWSRKT